MAEIHWRSAAWTSHASAEARRRLTDDARNTSLHDAAADCIAQRCGWSGAARLEFEVCLRMLISAALHSDCCQTFASGLVFATQVLRLCCIFA